MGHDAAFGMVVDWVLVQSKKKEMEPLAFSKKLVFQDIPHNYRDSFSPTPLPTNIEQTILQTHAETLHHTLDEIKYMMDFNIYCYERILSLVEYQAREADRRLVERTAPPLSQKTQSRNSKKSQKICLMQNISPHIVHNKIKLFI